MTESGAWQRLGAAVKGLGRRKVPFAEVSTGGFAGAPLYGDGFGGGWGSRSPGATYDYATAAGELWENRVVAACVNAISQALSDAPPYLERREGAAWVKVETHPVIELLNKPNGYYGSPHLWSATAASECTAGQAFWRIEKSRAGLPAELWWEDARRFRALGDAEHFIKGYRFQTERGGWVELANDDVIHFRHALNPYNPREGRTPLSTGLRQVALDNGIASYSGSILRNSGVMSLLVSTKDASASAQITPSQIQDFVDKLKQRLFGDGAGGIAGLNLPIDVQKMSYSPDEMAVDKLTNYAEASICALLGVDPMVCGLGSGTLQKTYANMGEALNDFWERRIIPAKNRHSAELGAQLLPLYGLDSKDHRIAWDYSKVAALQENDDQKHARVRADYQAGLIDLYAAQTAIGAVGDASKKGLYFGASANAGATAVKMIDWQGKGHSDGSGRYDGSGAGARGDSDVQAHDRRILAICQSGFDKFEFPEWRKKEYLNSMRSVLVMMPPEAKRRVAANLKKVVFYRSLPEFRMHYPNEDGRLNYGGYNEETGVAAFDGGDDDYSSEEIYAHEFAHAIEGAGKPISQSDAWKKAWLKEIKTKSDLSKYAADSESEGFAEFARLAYVSYPPTYMKEKFPDCYAVWKSYGLIE